MSEPHSNGMSPVGGSSPDGTTVKEEDDEFAALGGKTRLVSRKSPSVPSSPQGSLQQTNSPTEMLHHTYQVTTPTLGPDPNTPGPMDVGGEWPTYQPQETFEFYPSVQGQWHNEPGYVNVDPSTMAIHTHHPSHAATYPPYGQVPQMADPYVPIPSSMDGAFQTRLPAGSDADASWRNLFAQFNQA